MAASSDTPEQFLNRFVEEVEYENYFNNQVIASREIYDNFMMTTPLVLLLAQMQSGKSSTYFLLIALMIHFGLVDQAIVICGNSELELYDQCIKNKSDIINTYKKLFRKELSIIVKKSCELKKLTIHNRTLVIWDEAHYGQTTYQRIDKMFIRNNLLVNGTEQSITQWKTKESYLLTVSATPFSELANVKLSEAINKKIVVLNPGVNYRGISYYYNNNFIHESFPINCIEGANKLNDILKHHLDIVNPKYALIRCNDVEERNAIYRIVVNNDWLIISHDSEEKQVEGFGILNNRPVKNTIVLLKGLGRMGHVLPKKHISFCFETSLNANTDTLCQSLLGRMCGYDVNDNYSKDPIHIYVPPKFLHSDNKAIEEAEDKINECIKGVRKSQANINKQSIEANYNAQIYELRNGNSRSEIKRYIDIFENPESLDNPDTIPHKAMNIKSNSLNTAKRLTLSTKPVKIPSNGLTYDENMCLIMHFKNSSQTQYRTSAKLDDDSKNFIINNVIIYMESNLCFDDFKQHNEILSILKNAKERARNDEPNPYKYIVFRNFNSQSYKNKGLDEKAKFCLNNNKNFDDINLNSDDIKEARQVTIGYFGATKIDGEIVYKPTDDELSYIVLTGWTFQGDDNTVTNANKRCQVATTSKEVFALNRRTIVYSTCYFTEPQSVGVDHVYIRKNDIVTIAQFTKIANSVLEDVTVTQVPGRFNKDYPSRDYVRFVVTKHRANVLISQILISL